jgi:hypothetical protein
VDGAQIRTCLQCSVWTAVDGAQIRTCLQCSIWFAVGGAQIRTCLQCSTWFAVGGAQIRTCLQCMQLQLCVFAVYAIRKHKLHLIIVLLDTHTHTYARIHTRAHTHAHTHAHTNTQTHTQEPSPSRAKSGQAFPMQETPLPAVPPVLVVGALATIFQALTTGECVCVCS